MTPRCMCSCLASCWCRSKTHSFSNFLSFFSPSKKNGISSLSQLLVACLESVNKRCGHERHQRLSVEIADGVALVDDIGFAQFQVLVRRCDESPQDKFHCTLQDTVVSSGVVRVRFAPKSSQLASMALCSHDIRLVPTVDVRTSMDRTVAPQDKCVAVAVPLTTSTAFPSVVSLDPSALESGDTCYNSKDGAPVPSAYFEPHEVGMSYE